MREVRITVMRRTVYEDLMQEYENPIEHACDMEIGQTFISKNGRCPDGMCESAWSVMEPFVLELANGGGNFYNGWMRNKNSAMISCNDGFRPVSFYIEAGE
ncbi:MAG: TIGR04076 family protein [Spirochaetales bacterium]|nr:TIGR04076 family protein [Spirochaetales bacterium]